MYDLWNRLYALDLFSAVIKRLREVARTFNISKRLIYMKAAYFFELVFDEGI